MNGTFKRNLKDIGSIKIDNYKSVIDNLNIIKSSKKHIIFFGRIGT